MHSVAVVADGQKTLPALVDRAVVYFVEASGRVKIGYTRDIHKRISALRTAIPGELRLLRRIDGGRSIEKWLHKQFGAQRLNGEWFRFHPDMLSIIPPDEIIRPKRRIVRKNIRLTVLERLRNAEKAGREAGLSDRQILTTFVSQLTDEEARRLLDMAGRESGAL